MNPTDAAKILGHKDDTPDIIPLMCYDYPYLMSVFFGSQFNRLIWAYEGACLLSDTHHYQYFNVVGPRVAKMWEDVAKIQQLHFFASIEPGLLRDWTSNRKDWTEKRRRLLSAQVEREYALRNNYDSFELKEFVKLESTPHYRDKFDLFMREIPQHYHKWYCAGHWLDRLVAPYHFDVVPIDVHGQPKATIDRTQRIVGELSRYWIPYGSSSPDGDKDALRELALVIGDLPKVLMREVHSDIQFGIEDQGLRCDLHNRLAIELCRGAISGCDSPVVDQKRTKIDIFLAVLGVVNNENNTKYQILNIHMIYGLARNKWIGTALIDGFRKKTLGIKLVWNEGADNTTNITEFLDKLLAVSYSYSSE